MFQAHALLNIIITIILLSGYYNPPFKDEETEVHLNNLSTAKKCLTQDLNPGLFDLKVCAFLPYYSVSRR